MQVLPNLKIAYRAEYYDVEARFDLTSPAQYAAVCSLLGTHVLGRDWQHDVYDEEGYATAEFVLNRQRYFLSASLERGVLLTTDPDLVASGDEMDGAQDGGWFTRGVDAATQWHLFVAPLKALAAVVQS